MDEAEGCPWYVRRTVPWINDPDFEPDQPSDLYREEECGEALGPDGRFCENHGEAMALSDLEFEDALRSGVTWSNDHTPYD